MEDTLMENKKQDQEFAYQEKNKPAGEHWLDLITQITLDYRRLKDSRMPVQSKTQVAALTENNDALAV